MIAEGCSMTDPARNPSHGAQAKAATAATLPTAGELRVEGRPIAWRRDGALDGRPLVLLAHGAGAPLTSPFMQAVALGLAARDACAVRFHFPYMERNVRESRRGAPDRPPVLLATWHAVIAAWRDAAPAGTPIILAGKSMGGRIASLVLAESTPPDVRGAIYWGYPLSPAGRPAVVRADHLARVRVPQLFVSGSRDALCNLDRLRAVLASIGSRARLHVVEGGDHSLATSRKDPLQGSDAWLDAAAAFIAEIAG
jgi:predicted alpha/beta-hydrolase family hydrolase